MKMAIKYQGCVYRKITSSKYWDKTGKLPITGKDFTGTAILYSRGGDSPGPKYAAVCQIKMAGTRDAGSFIAANTGYIGDAVKKAFKIKAKVSLSAANKDWGPPIGVARNTDNFKSGKVTLLFV